MESISQINQTNEQTSATLQWLKQYFYDRKGVSISRCSMYSMYGTFCQQNSYRPVCKATFGKLIRIQFPFVTSKRLGARGQSKYHYYGIALKDNSQLTTTNDCDFDRPVTRFSRNARLLNPNDYHAILHSMLSISESTQKTPLEDSKMVFTNIYKIHCQCLVDAALGSNYSQMRHYIIHFWQQLPTHVNIDLETLKSLDSNFYSTLEDIYLKLDASMDQLRHLYAIATLNPLWLNKALDNYSNDAVRQLKLSQAFKWKCRVKAKFELIILAKTMDLTQIQSSINILLQLDYNELLFVNQSVLDTFLQLLTDISKRNATTLELIIDSFDEIVKKWGKIFSKELALGFNYLHSYTLKQLTQLQSPKFDKYVKSVLYYSYTPPIYTVFIKKQDHNASNLRESFLKSQLIK